MCKRRDAIIFKIYYERWKLRDFYLRRILQNRIFKKYLKRDFVMPIYAGKSVWGIQKTNDWIRDKIYSNEPFMVSRFGNTELQVVVNEVGKRLGATGQRNEIDKWFERLCYGAGFFPNDRNLISRFSDEMIYSCSCIDLIAMWQINMEDYMINKYMSSDVRLSFLTRIEPWNSEHPWTEALKGKKVLVIHPFEASIRQQYESNREKLFEDKRILPEFELKTLKAVQTIAGIRDERFRDWFEALEYMYNEAMKINFDIAIIGCGAYGMPLAAKLKKAGKQAIHLGGVTQILFGIKGKRWVEDDNFRLEFNKYWIYPADEEKPVGSEKVEDNCYWA